MYWKIIKIIRQCMYACVRNSLYVEFFLFNHLCTIHISITFILCVCERTTSWKSPLYFNTFVRNTNLFFAVLILYQIYPWNSGTRKQRLLMLRNRVRLDGLYSSYSINNASYYKKISETIPSDSMLDCRHTSTSLPGNTDIRFAALASIWPSYWTAFGCQVGIMKLMKNTSWRTRSSLMGQTSHGTRKLVFPPSRSAHTFVLYWMFSWWRERKD